MDSENTSRPFPRDYGQLGGFKISCHPDRFEAVRGDEVMSRPWDGGEIMPSLELLVDDVVERLMRKNAKQTK